MTSLLLSPQNSINPVMEISRHVFKDWKYSDTSWRVSGTIILWGIFTRTERRLLLMEFIQPMRLCSALGLKYVADSPRESILTGMFLSKWYWYRQLTTRSRWLMVAGDGELVSLW